MNTEWQSSQPKIEAAAGTTLITIGASTVTVIEYKGKRVVTFAMVDQVHQRPEGTAKRNFQANKDHFIEGDDFYLIGRDEIRTDLWESFGFSKFAPIRYSLDPIWLPG